MLGRLEHRPAGVADGRERLAGRPERHRRDREVLGRHALGDRDQRVRVLIEHRAGAGIEAGDDLVEAPVHAVLRRVAVLVQIDHELQALDRVRAVQRAVALLVEVIVVAHHVGHHHDVAVGPAGAAAQAEAVLAVELRDLARRLHEVVHGLGRAGETGLLEQLLVPEHRPQVEAVGDHVHRVVDVAAELDRARVELAAFVPALHVGAEIDQLVVVGVERQPAVRHLDHVRDLAALDHGRELLEGLAPGQGRDLDLNLRDWRPRTSRPCPAAPRSAAGS